MLRHAPWFVLKEVLALKFDQKERGRFIASYCDDIEGFLNVMRLHDSFEETPKVLRLEFVDTTLQIQKKYEQKWGKST
eukprot:TRINITY_DN3354_c0_g1_i2.p2 TRINITY_DN3354_c0_g1~~TRINITY_DN3354_c0_g1_i2.p2  ORF type:complete len:78 (-),score=10.99 TRINITY_DN3354_c0_g1_i2:372-605(-)